MRYELNDAMLNKAMLNDETLGELPDELAELGLQLGSDADRLTGLYPARLLASDALSAGDALPADNELLRPIANPQVSRRGISWVGTLSRVAAAVCILGGLALAISGQSLWRGMFGSPDSRQLTPSLATAPRSLPMADDPGAGPGAMQPVFISTEAMRQFSGEEKEILADAIPHGGSAIVIADL